VLGEPSSNLEYENTDLMTSESLFCMECLYYRQYRGSLTGPYPVLQQVKGSKQPVFYPFFIWILLSFYALLPICLLLWNLIADLHLL